MAELVYECPRCGVQRVTFRIRGIIPDRTIPDQYNKYDYFCECGVCHSAVVLNIRLRNDLFSRQLSSDEVIKKAGMIDNHITVLGYSTSADYIYKRPPEFLPPDIEAAFIEGAKCMSIGCYNAAATMFRLCLDFATKSLLPEGEAIGLNNSTRRSLGLRM